MATDSAGLHTGPQQTKRKVYLDKDENSEVIINTSLIRKKEYYERLYDVII